ncbi:MAG: hypothetical protein IJM89_04720 [Bacteroidales bacterium]|nr:hypothetical protein [Bacteroidales bacterium]
MIPPFNHDYVLPPYVGDNPTKVGTQSPYRVSIMDLCQYFSTSKPRIELLKGLIKFRLEFYSRGIINTIQWIDGSFVEDKYSRENEEPNDIDVVTFINLPKAVQQTIATSFPAFVDHKQSKHLYHVDHYVLDISDPTSAVRNTQYWIQLFSHNRYGVWKGMIEVPLYVNAEEDIKAMDYLNGLVL